MRLKLFHKLFLLVALTALVAALAMAAVMAWNLQRGFADYLDARDIEAIDNYAAVMAREAKARGGVEALKSGRLTLESLEKALVREGVITGRPPIDRPGRPLLNRLDRAASADKSSRPRRPPRRGPPLSFGRRLLLFDANEKQIFGPPPPPADGPKMTARQIAVDGQKVGTVKLLPHGPPSVGVEARFLRSQYVNAALLLAGLMACAGLAAWGFARAGVRRLANMEGATKAIADGNFDVRTEDTGSDEVSSMGRNINQMAASLARADQARRGWLAEIGHELRTPLTVLSGELQALNDGIRPLDMAAIASLSQETERLGALIEDLHFMAVSDLTDAPSSFSRYDAITLMKAVVERFQPILAQAGLKLETDLKTADALSVIWDGKRIEQLLGNLLTNAMRYTDAPGTVCLSLASGQDRVVITLEDSPPGVPDEALSRLFEPLFRVDEARDRASGGSGLGLAVCKAIVDAHGGQISARKSELGGLLVEVELPLDAAKK